MSTSTGDRAKYRRSRYQIIDLRTSSIADGSLHVPSHGQYQSPDEIIGRDNDIVRELDASGEPIRGGRKLNDAAAAIVRRIFTEFAHGKSPIAIARQLNAESIPALAEWRQIAA